MQVPFQNSFWHTQQDFMQIPRLRNNAYQLWVDLELERPLKFLFLLFAGDRQAQTRFASWKNLNRRKLTPSRVIDLRKAFIVVVCQRQHYRTL